MMRSRTWLLLAACVVTFLAIGLWSREAKKEVKKDVLPEVQVLPEVETLQEPQQGVIKKVLPKKPNNSVVVRWYGNMNLDFINILSFK